MNKAAACTALEKVDSVGLCPSRPASDGNLVVLVVVVMMGEVFPDFSTGPGSPGGPGVPRAKSKLIVSRAITQVVWIPQRNTSHVAIFISLEFGGDTGETQNSKRKTRVGREKAVRVGIV